jgi:TrpR-related protein YerC/YecD
MTRKAPKTQSWVDKREEELCEALLSLKSAKDAQRFLDDLCTPAELRALADRWKVARLIAQELPYRKIQEQTGVSTATIARVARALLYGDGGYRRVLEKLAPEQKSEKARA